MTQKQPDGHSASAWSSAWLGLIPLFMNTGKLSTPQKISPTNLHAGTYYGYWSGYVIRLPLKDGDVEIKTEHGVRGVVKCVVTIDESGALSVMPNK